MEKAGTGLEYLSMRQETINRIYAKFLQLPVIDADIEPIDPKKPTTKENQRITAIKFVYYFPEGTTEQGYTDQISGTYTIETEELAVFYAKGIFATRMTLKKNPQTQDVELVKSMVWQKSKQGDNGRSIMSPAVTESGEPRKPYLHAAESLLDDLGREIVRNPKLFRNAQRESLLSEAEREHKERVAGRLGAVLRNELIRKEADARRNHKSRRSGKIKKPDNSSG